MQLFQIGGLYILVQYKVEPPISDHPRCKDLVVAYKNRTTGVFFWEDVQTRILYEK